MNTTKDLIKGAKLGLWSTFVFTPCVAIIKAKRLYNTTVDMYKDAYQIANVKDLEGEVITVNY